MPVFAGGQPAYRLAALDPDSEVKEVELHSGMEELRRRLEILLGAKPEAPPDLSQQERTRQHGERLPSPPPRTSRWSAALSSSVRTFSPLAP